MKVGPSALARFISSRVPISASPRSIMEWGAEVGTALEAYASRSVDVEELERWTPQILRVLRRELDELNRLGRVALYAFNSSSPDLIQGAAFAEPCDADDVKAAKVKRAQFGSYLAALRGLTPREFEALCAGVLSEIGVERPVLTRYSADQGIDFYGRLRLSGTVLPGVHAQMSVWMIGQAKHYLASKVSTPDVRDLIGAVILARGRAFGIPGADLYADLTIRVCDPVFYLFFCTGALSSDAWGLLDRSGVVGMDGEMLSAFLADHAIGQTEGAFDKDALLAWLSGFASADAT